MVSVSATHAVIDSAVSDLQRKIVEVVSSSQSSKSQQIHGESPSRTEHRLTALKVDIEGTPINLTVFLIYVLKKMFL